jgi:hypothetical protein
MLPSLPILVFGALFIMWSRTSLAPAKKPPSEEDKGNNDNKIIVKVVSADESA